MAPPNIDVDIDPEEYFYNIYKEAMGDDADLDEFEVETLSNEDIKILKESPISKFKEFCVMEKVKVKGKVHLNFHQR